jgi:ribonucleotide reductase beta subunit family protein with ferritin-like domain
LNFKIDIKKIIKNKNLKMLIESNLEKFTFDPEKDPIEFNFYTRQLAMFWNPDEYSFNKDKEDYKIADDFIKHLFNGINCFFLVGDGKVSESLIKLIISVMEKKGMSSSLFLMVQLANEATHAQSYNKAARKIIPPSVLETILNEILSLSCIQDKIKYIDIAEKEDDSSSEDYELSKGLKYVRLACGEGMFFVTQFAIIGLFKSLNIFSDFCSLNDHIFKDEMLHALHKCVNARKFLKPDEKEQAIEQIKLAVKYELAFLSYLLNFEDKDSKFEKYDINFEMLSDFAKIRANSIAEGCGLEEIYKVERDFPGWTSLIGGLVKINFFEEQLNSAYQTSAKDSHLPLPTSIPPGSKF